MTGVNRGIGYAIAKGLKKQGHRVFIGVRDTIKGSKAAQELGVEFVELDMAKPATFPNIIKQTGGIDILVNNAGILLQGSMLDDPQDFETSMAIMVHGPYHLIRLCEPHMRNQNWGRIINLTSSWGAFEEGLQGPNAYGVAKASLNALSKALVRDLPSGVQINAMCPG